MSASMPLIQLIVERGGRRRQVLFVREPQVILGRGEGCGIRIPSSEISRQHCRFRFRNGRLSLEDLGSVNGTYLNGKLLSGREIVVSGDRIEVGPVTFRVLYLGPDERSSREQEPRTSAGQEVEEVLDVLEVEEVEEVAPEPGKGSRPPSSRGPLEQTRVLGDMDSLRLPSPEELRRILEEMDREDEAQ